MHELMGTFLTRTITLSEAAPLGKDFSLFMISVMTHPSGITNDPKVSCVSSWVLSWLYCG